ncbi:hypothetical protein NQ176_g4932 [Zarea fungicola]|uniref:Uncharacterized protein n=1 Tax=Zarea fungicola TaxID=93591 RepID=A0ACC1NCA6_9HYPO|nr:hypothetical protein NQ176_g4932 [Lecanicillium fungicola]
MKYSALTVAALLVAPSLSLPKISSPGQIILTNNMNRPIRLDKRVRPIRLDKRADESIILHQGQTIQLAASEKSLDLKLSEQNAQHSQVEVGYTSNDQGTYGFNIKPVEGGGFPGKIEVIPFTARPSPQCFSLVWKPGQESTKQSTCEDHTSLRVFLLEVPLPA